MLRHSVRALPIALLVTLSLACGQDASVSPGQTDAQMSMAASPAPSAEVGKAVAMRGQELAAVVDASGAGGQIKTEGSAAPAIPSMIIRNGSASVQVDSLELAIIAVQKMAASFGGYVGNTSLSAGEYQLRSATLELKIPSARYDDALAGLKPIGKVESVSSTAEDVGEEFVDVSARVANAHRLEDRLITLLATRTGKLEDVLAVERELARVREEIERYEGRIRFLKSRVATSTLSVTVHERAPLVSASPGENVLVNAFKDAWRNFVHFIAAFISMLGVIIPSLVLVAVLIVGWRRWRRRGA
ncbi:MAG: DUF4349 domain-containing protein [Gemmatimonadaceae bacterium]|nr:DUF4349 domain-containing protein [Gemmatimonadaceae bacterium]